jgi:hypothetical protein
MVKEDEELGKSTTQMDGSVYPGPSTLNIPLHSDTVEMDYITIHSSPMGSPYPISYLRHQPIYISESSIVIKPTRHLEYTLQLTPSPKENPKSSSPPHPTLSPSPPTSPLKHESHPDHRYNSRHRKANSPRARHTRSSPDLVVGSK